MTKIKNKADYVNELELKSFLIRVKNKKQNIGTLDANKRINELISVFLTLNSSSYKHPNNSKKVGLKNKLKARIIKLSEITKADEESYNMFAKCVLLMIKRILTKPQFSGYTYKDDFYSDATYKILKYMNNFDHTLISKVSGQSVNAFSYISQIIHNSIIYMIREHKKYNDAMIQEYDRKQIILNISKKHFFNDPENNIKTPLTITRYLNSADDVLKEHEYIDNLNFSNNYSIDYVLTPETQEYLNDNQSVYQDLTEHLFNKSIVAKFATQEV